MLAAWCLSVGLQVGCCSRHPGCAPTPAPLSWPAPATPKPAALAAQASPPHPHLGRNAQRGAAAARLIKRISQAGRGIVKLRVIVIAILLLLPLHLPLLLLLLLLLLPLHLPLLLLLLPFRLPLLLLLLLLLLGVPPLLQLLRVLLLRQRHVACSWNGGMAVAGGACTSPDVRTKENTPAWACAALRTQDTSQHPPT